MKNEEDSIAIRRKTVLQNGSRSLADSNRRKVTLQDDINQALVNLYDDLGLNGREPCFRPFRPLPCGQTSPSGFSPKKPGIFTGSEYAGTVSAPLFPRWIRPCFQPGRDLEIRRKTNSGQEKTAFADWNNSKFLTGSTRMFSSRPILTFRRLVPKDSLNAKSSRRRRETQSIFFQYLRSYAPLP